MHDTVRIIWSVINCSFAVRGSFNDDGTLKYVGFSAIFPARKFEIRETRWNVKFAELVAV
jgi:hypothetical protein